MNRHWVLLYFIILFCYFISPACANNSFKELNPAEKFVILQVTKGEKADLREFPEDSRILRAAFLKRVLKETFPGLKVTEKGIIIWNARIKEKLDFRGTKILFPVSLISCIFKKGVDFSGTEFSGKVDFLRTNFIEMADFTDAKFLEKVYFSAAFSGHTRFRSAKFFNEAYFGNAKFDGSVDFRKVKFFRKAYFESVRFTRSTESPFRPPSFSKAEFSGKADFIFAIFFEGTDFKNVKFSEGPSFRWACLRNVDLSGSDLSRADLSETDLSGANLSEANLKDSLLWNVRGFPFNYEPKAGSPPYIPSFASFPNLSKLTFRKSPHGLVDLREGFKKLGYREQERKITYALKHTLNQKLLMSDDNWARFEGKLQLYLFGKTCKWGMTPSQPLLILIYLIIGFSFVYMFGIIGLGKKDGIWKVWIEGRVRSDLKKNNPKKLLICKEAYKIWGYGFYFSLLSAFNIGWRELTVGNWIARIHPREYTLRASGWVRTVSGIQSIISVYLLALSVLTYFGRPFDQF